MALTPPFGVHGLARGCLSLWLGPLGVCRPVTSALGLCLLSPGLALGPTLGWGVRREVLTFPSSVP